MKSPKRSAIWLRGSTRGQISGPTFFLNFNRQSMTPIATRKKAPDPAQRQAIERGLASAFAYAAETGQQAMLKKDFISAKSMFQAGEVIQPESAWASYLSATACAQLGEKKPAIQELKKAMEKGMTSAKALDDAAFDRIREEQGFKEVVASLSKSQPK